MQRQEREEFAKTEGSCTVTTVDGAAAPAGWSCRCFTSGGATQYSFKGPGFNQWVKGEDGCPVTNPQSYSVTDPATGEIFCVQANCT